MVTYVHPIPLQQFHPEGMVIPLYGGRVQAGFPSPADDFLEGQIDLNTQLIKHPAATFMVRAQGDSMVGAGIFDGDVLVVDRSLEASEGKVVIVALNGELTVKRLCYRQGRPELHPENPRHKPILIPEGQELHIWGVVTNVIHAL